VVIEVADRLAPMDLEDRLFWWNNPCMKVGNNEWAVDNGE